MRRLMTSISPRSPLALTALAAALLLATAPSTAHAAEPDPAAEEYDDEAPDEDFVWETGDELEDGTTAEGFYRVRVRPGFTWVAGRYEGGAWIPPHWAPADPPPAGKVWVRGHRGPDGYWVPGHWRPVQRDGFRWVPGRVVDGAWVHGHWTPVAVRRGEVWVPGHWSPRGEWIEGHWRPAARRDYTWVPGHWRYGAWVPGHWRPVNPRPGHVWVAGHRGPRGWVEGRWRPAAKAGHHWVGGGWVGGAWRAGRWVAGARPAVARRHRVRPVRAMTRVDKPRLWRAGKAQERRGERMQDRGERMQERGEKTGNKRLERRGERVEDRGERKERRGDRKQRRAK